MNEEINLKDHIRDIPDWPKKGVLFRDITPMLSDAKAFSYAVEKLAGCFKEKEVDQVAGIEARGFIFGAAVAEKIGAGFIPIRKKGKLPHDIATIDYDLEYGTDTLEVHADSVLKGNKILMLDDLLATGGTMAAACELIEKIGGQVQGIAFLVELEFLKGIEKLRKYDVKTLLKY